MTFCRIDSFKSSRIVCGSRVHTIEDRVDGMTIEDRVEGTIKLLRLEDELITGGGVGVGAGVSDLKDGSS